MHGEFSGWSVPFGNFLDTPLLYIVEFTFSLPMTDVTTSPLTICERRKIENWDIGKHIQAITNVNATCAVPLSIDKTSEHQLSMGFTICNDISFSGSCLP